jgi:S1-C subfamily serine protease
MDDLDRMLSGGAKGAKFESPGDTVSGIVDDVMIRQATEYGTGKPLTFDNGDPREQIVIVLKVDNHVPEDDDGFRAVYIKGWGHQRRAFIQATKDGGKPVQGSRFTASFVRLEPSKAGGFPAKVFEYRIQQLDTFPASDEASGSELADARAQVAKLDAMGTFTVEQISAATGIDVAEVRALTSTTPF